MKQAIWVLILSTAWAEPSSLGGTSLFENDGGDAVYRFRTYGSCPGRIHVDLRGGAVFGAGCARRVAAAVTRMRSGQREVCNGRREAARADRIARPIATAGSRYDHPLCAAC